jgi:tetratricopeptide (TPR) repeat protein
LVAEARGYKQLRNAAWRRLIRCQARFVKLVESVAPSDSELAEAALELQPAEAESYFWLAQLRAQQAPEQAAELYVRGLELRPEDGLRWLELGDLIAGTQPRVALDAYVNACENGDPGANGCYRAGRIAEALNDPKLAIRYYRMSRWSAAISRAEQLERLLER